MADVVNLTKGHGLVVDYGENQALSDSLWGIKNHKYVDMDTILHKPGEVDLSCYVNFQSLSHIA